MYTIYVLKCEQDKYYVGKTTDKDSRINDHFSGNGCAWTKKYKPISLFETFENCDSFDEDKYVKKYMLEHGVDNVRGGSYSQISLDEISRETIRRELVGCTDKCWECGESGHFSSDCSNEMKHTNDIPKEPIIITTCLLCGKCGHNSFACPLSEYNIKKKENEAVRLERYSKNRDKSNDMCYHCKNTGHWSYQCTN
jgi:predicted GIY-YIG superfamily endonuclease